MIGRETELRLVDAFLDAADLGPRAIVFDGDAGIGKTTIWQAALDAAIARGDRVVMTRPTAAEARLPFAGLNDLFGDLHDAFGSDLPSPQRAALDIALMRASPAGEPTQPLALSLGVLELMRLAAARGPLVIGIDDVQWLDESSDGVLGFALRRLESERVIVVATERSPGAGSSPAVVDDLPAERVSRVPVRALSAEETDRLLEASLGLRLAPTVLRRVHRLAGGNPFYVLEVGRSLEKGGTDAAARHPPLPDATGELVRTRLAALSDEAREVVVNLSALSHPTASLLEAALGRERAIAGLAAAREAEVVAPGDDPIRLTHPLLATEAYAELGEAERRDLHRRLAEVVAEPEESGAPHGSGGDRARCRRCRCAGRSRGTRARPGGARGGR